MTHNQMSFRGQLYSPRVSMSYRYPSMAEPIKVCHGVQIAKTFHLTRHSQPGSIGTWTFILPSSMAQLLTELLHRLGLMPPPHGAGAALQCPSSCSSLPPAGASCADTSRDWVGAPPPGAGAALQSISAAALLLHKKLKLKNPETNNEFNLV